MTSFSLDFRQAMADEHSDVVPILLLTFTHPSLPSPLRLSSDRGPRLSEDPLTYGTISRGNTFLWLPMSIILPGDDDQAAPELRLVIDAIDRNIYAVIRSSSEPATCKLEMVQSGSVDTVEMSIDNLETQSAPYDDSSVQLVMGQESFWGEQWPRGLMTPTTAPGLHP